MMNKRKTERKKEGKIVELERRKERKWEGKEE